VVSSKKISTVMSPIRRRMKKRNPSGGQNGQLVHWWLLFHSGRSWVLANCCGICWKWQQQVTKGLEKLPPPRPKDWLGAKDFPKVPRCIECWENQNPWVSMFSKDWLASSLSHSHSLSIAICPDPHPSIASAAKKKIMATSCKRRVPL
jgi:hypothetical protein